MEIVATGIVNEMRMEMESICQRKDICLPLNDNCNAAKVFTRTENKNEEIGVAAVATAADDAVMKQLGVG